jgi:hypothetical protein
MLMDASKHILKYGLKNGLQERRLKHFMHYYTHSKMCLYGFLLVLHIRIHTPTTTKKLPSIAFPQEDCNTCVTSSFASCLHSKLISDSDLQSKNLFRSLVNFPAHIEQYGREYIANCSNNQSKIIQSFCTMLREKHEFSKLFEINKN